MNHLPFNYSDIEAVIRDERILALGRAYWRQGNVRNVAIEEDGYLVTGVVRESQTKSLTVVIRTLPGGSSKSVNDKRSVALESHCSCAVGTACKHVVALCLEALDTQKHLGKRSAPSKIVPLAKAFQNIKNMPKEQIAGSSLLGDSEKQKDDNLNHELSISSKYEERVAYILNAAEDTRSMQHATYMVARPVVLRLSKGGNYAEPREIELKSLLQNRASFITADDHVIGKLMLSSLYSNREEFRSPPGDPKLLDQVMHRMVATGRCFFRSSKTDPLMLGANKLAKLGWQLELDGAQTPAIIVDKDPSRYFILPAAQPWYVDLNTKQAGPLSFAEPLASVRKFLSGAKVLSTDVAAVARVMSQDPLTKTIAPLRLVKIEKRTDVQPIPCLHLTIYATGIKEPFRDGFVDVMQHLAFLHFEYEGVVIHPNVTGDFVSLDKGDRLISMPRDRATESGVDRDLKERLGIELSPMQPLEAMKGWVGYTFSQALSARMQWLDFLNREVPELRSKGWRITVDDGFASQFKVVAPDAQDKNWEVDLREQKNDAWWFSLDLGILVEGQRVALLPLLMQVLKRLREPSTEAIEKLALSGTIYVDLPDGSALALPYARVRDMLMTLVELYNQPLNKDGSLTVSIDLAAALSRIHSATQMRWLGGARLRKMIERLKDFEGLAVIKPPAGLKGILRAYQCDGLNWLQFLREYNLGGILADDMGLGKTIQTLAHILIEKEKGRLKHPCLIICPTSLIPNWQDEAEKFAPDLKVISLHGKNRVVRFSEIEKADLVLTTYSLLKRDSQALLPLDWHIVVLDEAQAIKNPTSQATQLVCELKAAHRLCLTGTPVENHLGELWSHFSFLMPGMLGTHKDFNKRFRRPIEKLKDLERQALLAARLKPFILRRNKSNVAKELPPKTEIIHHVEFDSAQRDLYETMRMTMHEKVQEAVKSKGFSKSHIVILSALLKLRQVCCDPRLLKLEAAKKVTQSAKLESLMDMLPEMIEEGRRILLFSQFTSMIDLIKPELEKAKIRYVELRGDTVDRKTPVAEFQTGDVPLFLISLKAGGTGLNLTAADTVIHFDPWWNPAVENQATDRAHRIGQDKPVFVYKFIVRGTVEEHILDLQDRKRNVATAMLEERSDGSGAFEVNDLALLFQDRSK